MSGSQERSCRGRERLASRAGRASPPPSCSLRIAGGAPRGKVSRRVEALRNDMRMRLHGAPIEREKTGTERGKYQHSEYNGEPAEMGIDYVAERGVFSALRRDRRHAAQPGRAHAFASGAARRVGDCG